MRRVPAMRTSAGKRKFEFCGGGETGAGGEGISFSAPLDETGSGVGAGVTVPRGAVGAAEGAVLVGMTLGATSVVVAFSGTADAIPVSLAEVTGVSPEAVAPSLCDEAKDTGKANKNTVTKNDTVRKIGW